jgi:hypothetical protein
VVQEDDGTVTVYLDEARDLALSGHAVTLGNLVGLGRLA